MTDDPRKRLEEMIANLRASRDIFSDEEIAQQLAPLERRLAALGGTPAPAATSPAMSVSAAIPAGTDIFADHRSIAVAGPANSSFFNTGTFEGNVYVGPKPQDPEEALTIYRRMLVQVNSDVPLRALDVKTADAARRAERLDLVAVYVDLDTTTTVRIPGKATEGGRRLVHEDYQETRSLRALEVAAQHGRIVVLGDPGSGKSTLLSHLALCLAAHALEPKRGWNKRLADWPPALATLLPIQVVLRDFARKIPEGEEALVPRHLWEFIQARLHDQNLSLASDAIHAALREGRALVLLDGLDEIPTPKQRQFVRDAVNAFANTYEGARFLVTCRTLSYRDDEPQLPGFEAVTLAPFNDAKIGAFIDAWYRELSCRGTLSVKEADEHTARLRGAVQRPDLMGLATNPLLLTVMALVHAHLGKLPEKRALLYEETVEVLLWRWEELRTRRLRTLLEQVNRQEIDLKRVLWRLAFEVHASTGEDGKSGLADIAESKVEKALRELHHEKSRDWAHAVVEAMKLRAGLLLERAPEVYTFPHRTFQEYLAGVHLTVEGDFTKRAAALVRKGPLWTEVVLLAVGHLVHRHGITDRPLALVGELCPEQRVDSEVSRRELLFAADMVAEIEPARVEEGLLGRDLIKRVRAQLLDLMRDERVPALIRAQAGDGLGRIGDPRFSAEAFYLPSGPDEPLLGFVKVPAGPFLMGSDPKRDSQAFDEQPQHTVDLDEYFVARYPVTVAQFRAFVEDSGDVPENPRWARGLPNHPVIWVTADEANRYTEWLTRRLAEWYKTPDSLRRLLRSRDAGGRRWRVTLPSEAEWEKAARGADGRIYPWGIYTTQTVSTARRLELAVQRQ